MHRTPRRPAQPMCADGHGLRAFAFAFEVGWVGDTYDMCGSRMYRMIENGLAWTCAGERIVTGHAWSCTGNVRFVMAKRGNVLNMHDCK